jgi:hypothetical protein
VNTKSILNAYWNEVRAGFSRLPVWFPGTPMDLGDVGVLDPGGWTKLMTLRDLGASYTIEEVGATSDIEYASEGGVEILAGTGQVGVQLTQGQAAGHTYLTYKFHRAGSFVWRASGVATRRITDLAAVQERVLGLYAAGQWQRQWILVTEVTVGGPVLILVAAEKDTEVEVGVKVGLESTAVNVSAAPHVVIGANRNLASKVVTEEPTAVMWRGRVVADPLFRSARLIDKYRQKGIEHGTASSAVLIDVDVLSEVLIADGPK